MCHSKTLVAASLLSVMAFGPPASAQTSQTGAYPEIVVVHPLIRRADLVAPIMTVTISKPIAYNDLDLTTVYGAYTLRQRIRDAAHYICNRLQGLYFGGTPDRDTCYKSVKNQGQLEADSAFGGYRRVASLSPTPQ